MLKSVLSGLWSGLLLAAQVAAIAATGWFMLVMVSLAAGYS